MKKANNFIIALFMIPLFFLATLNLFWPDQMRSSEENRNLSRWPSLSSQALFSGKYFMDIETYFSDQFPFRQLFVNTHQKAINLLKSPFRGDISMVLRPGGDLGVGERLEPDPSDILIIPSHTSPETTAPTETIPTVETSATEEPLLTAGPSAEPTPMPATQPEVTAPPVEGKVITYSAVIILNDRAMELFSFTPSSAGRYIETVGKLKDKLPDRRVMTMIAPTSVEFYSPDKYHSGSSSQKNAIASIYGSMPDSIIKIDAYGKIISRVQDYLYFRTDHHWTARGAYHAYTAFCESAGLDAVPMEAMASGFIDGGFVGTFYRYTKSEIMKNNPDRVEYFMPIVASQGIAYSSASMSEGHRIRAVFPQISSSNKYLAFIGGDNPLAHFKTDLSNGRSIVVLKESFGNAFVPFLTNHYENVYVIDPRSLTIDLPKFIRDKNIHDILILNYSFSVSSSNWVDGFANMIK